MLCLSSGNNRHQSILCWLLHKLFLLKNMKSQLEDLQRLKEASNQKLLCSFQVAALVSNSDKCRSHHRGCLNHKLWVDLPIYHCIDTQVTGMSLIHH